MMCNELEIVSFLWLGVIWSNFHRLMGAAQLKKGNP